MAALYYASVVLIFVLVSSSESQSDFNQNATVSLPMSASTLNLAPDQPSDLVPEDVFDGIYLNPRKNPQNCSRGSEPKWLCNSDSVFSPNEVSILEDQLEFLYETENVCPCQNEYCSYSGFPMVVIVLSTFQFNNAESFEDKHQQIQDLAKRFLNHTDFDTCDDGAVTVAVASENLIVTEVGEMSSMTLSLSCKEAIENSTKYILEEEGNLYVGLLELITQYRVAVRKEHLCNSHEILATDRAVKTYILIPLVLILVGLIASAVIAGALLTYRQRRQSKDITIEANQPLKDRQPQSENA